MKKTAVVTALMLVGVAGMVFGQVNGGAPRGQQHSQPAGSLPAAGQKDGMSQETKQNMTAMMKRMNETMQKVTEAFENKAGRDTRNPLVIGRMMREMSLQMSEMAAAIEKGRVDPQTFINMQARMDSVNQRIEALP